MNQPTPKITELHQLIIDALFGQLMEDIKKTAKQTL